MKTPIYFLWLSSSVSQYRTATHWGPYQQTHTVRYCSVGTVPQVRSITLGWFPCVVDLNWFDFNWFDIISCTSGDFFFVLHPSLWYHTKATPMPYANWWTAATFIYSDYHDNARLFFTEIIWNSTLFDHSEIFIFFFSFLFNSFHSPIAHVSFSLTCPPQCLPLQNPV